jgi:hypothetical protein
MRKIIEDFCITTESTIKVLETTQYRITNASKNGSKYNFDYNEVPDYKHYEFLETFGFLIAIGADFGFVSSFMADIRALEF